MPCTARDERGSVDPRPLVAAPLKLFGLSNWANVIQVDPRPLVAAPLKRSGVIPTSKLTKVVDPRPLVAAPLKLDDFPYGARIETALIRDLWSRPH
jgi:hypothetical protein